MSITRDGREARNLVGSDEVINFTTLHIGAAMVPSPETCISLTGPWLAKPLRQILGIGTHVQCRCRIAPDLPDRFGFSQPVEEPRLLLAAQNGLRGRIFAEIGNINISIADRCR